MTDIAIPRKRVIRTPVGLLLSIGSEKPERGPGRPIDHFRPKPGELNQFAAEAAKFTEVYGDEPKELTDLYFLLDSVPAVLDIRLLAFSQSGIRGVGGTNFAEIVDDTDFEARVWGEHSFKDTFTFFPKDVSEVRPELRENWEGEPIEGELTGRDDPRVKRLEVKVVASLEFSLPEVMGIGKVARISTSGRASIRNLWKALWTEYEAFGYRLSGIPFRLALRPRPTQRFEASEKKYVRTTVYELVIDTTHTVSELRAALEEHRKAFGGIPGRDRLALEGQAMKQAMALPPGGEEEQIRDEPEAEVSDALLNRLAALEAEFSEDAVRLMLVGNFGVESANELDAEQAERYWQMLERAAPVEEVEGDVIDDVSAEGPGEEQGADGTQEAAPASREDLGDLPAGEERDPSPSADVSSGAESTDAATSASDPLPGEPGALMDPVDVAGDLVIPIGTHAGRLTIATVDETWLRYSLQRPNLFENHKAFYSGLEYWVRERLPELWKEVRG